MSLFKKFTFHHEEISVRDQPYHPATPATPGSWLDHIDFKSPDISILIDDVLDDITEFQVSHPSTQMSPLPRSQFNPYQIENELHISDTESISLHCVSASETNTLNTWTDSDTVSAYLKNIIKHAKTDIFKSITDLCLSYYSDNEYFAETAQETTAVSHMTALYAYYSEGTSYGHINIRQNNAYNLYIWTFKLSLMDQSIVAIGIDSSQKQYTDSAFHDSSNKHKYYASEMLVMASYSMKYSLNETQSMYGDSVIDGDEVQMELNVSDRTLSFSVNKTAQGIAFENIEFGNDINYCMAVYAWKVPSISLTNFVCK